MNRKEAMRQTHQHGTLLSLGFTDTEANSLRRISMTLQRWYELECGDGHGYIERDEATGKPYYRNTSHSYLDPNDPRATWAIPDRENGAVRRLAAIVKARNAREFHTIVPTAVNSYLQTDPRGAALYILRPGDIPANADPGSYYPRGLCVY